jgi:NAD+ kinase
VGRSLPAAPFAARIGPVPRIALVLHPARPEVGDLARAARRWWEERGYQVVELASTAGTIDEAVGDGPLELAVSLGGDGTMLRTVQLANGLGAPVLGVNLGRMGYLTEVEPAGLESAFARVVAGEYRVAERMMLAVELQPATPVEDPPAGSQQLVALNEAIVEKVAPGRTIRVDVAIAGRPFLTYTADGLIVSTPTGSTAYNLSARGPIVSPSLRAVVVTPISPHMLFDRSLVLDPDEVVTLQLAEGPEAALVLDGTSSRRLLPGDAVRCTAAERPARLVTFGNRDFHAILRAKFGLASR